MADPKEPAPSKRVAVITEDGKFGTIDEQYADEIRNAGGRVLSRKEQAERAEEEAYDKLPTGVKVLGGINTALGVAAGPIGWAAGGTAAPTQALRGYSQGVQKGITAGLGDAGGRKIAEAVGGQEAGQKYAEAVDTAAEASPVAQGIGQGVGLVGSAAAGSAAGTAAKLSMPGAAIGALGDLAEGGVQAAGRALGYEGASALGRAGMAAAELGVRGAAEGALYAGAESAGDAVLHDVDNATDKIFSSMGTGALYGGLGGAALGASGSLLKSGVRAGLARVMRPAEVAEGAAAAQAGEATASQVKWLRGMSNEMAADALGATKTQMADALEHVAPEMKDAKRAVGEYVNRIGIGKAVDGATGATGAWRAGANGRGDQLLEAIRGDKYGRVADGLSNAIGAQPARVQIGDLFDQAVAIHGDMIKDPAKIAGAQAFFDRVNTELGALRNAGKVADDFTQAANISAQDAFYTRASMAKQAYEMGKASGAAGDAYKEFLRRFDRMTIDAIDKAASEAGPSNAKQQILHWKREWQLASAAEKMAEKGAERFQGNNTFGIREAIAAGTALASGHVLGAAATLVGGKIMRERGSAVAAYGLARLADRAAAAQLVEKTNALIGKASKGLLAAPAKGALPASVQMPTSKSLAKLAITRVAEFQADPDAYIDKATRQTEALGVHSPEIASALVARQVQAAQFLASKVPVTPDPDPLDPHPAPKMTANEEATLGRYAWYVEQPSRFFHEVAHGKVTFEGAETAQALMPGAFAELQQQTAEQLATMMSRSNKPPFRQRQYIGVLLDFAATPSQRPDHAAFLQKNVTMDEPSPPPPKQGPPMKAPAMASYDRLEAGGLGQ